MSISSAARCWRCGLGTAIRLGGLLLLTPAWAVHAAALADDTIPWLEKMLLAPVQSSYEGEMVYVQGDTMTTLGINHQVTNGAVDEHIFALDGAQREVVRNSKRLACKVSRGELLEMPLDGHGDLNNRLMTRIKDIGDYYSVELGGHERIANRDTRRLSLMPMGDFRYGHRVWLDTETGLPLRTQLVDSDDSVLEQVIFTSITYLPTPAPTASATTISAGGHDNDPSLNATADFDEGRASDLAWQVQHLPTGFKLSSQQRLHDDDRPVDHLVYSDGLATVSVFIEELGSERGFSGVSQQGTITLYGRPYAGHQVTVIGEVPELTVRHIGDGIELLAVGDNR